MNFVGTAGWNVPRAIAASFPSGGTHLQRYAQVFNCVEINSSFYRNHAVTTYQRWADSTPPTFRFSVKMHRAVTHFERLRRSRTSVQQFLVEVSGLGEKLGAILIQLPPSLDFDLRANSRFFAMVRELYQGAVVLEPRHASWFEPRVDSVLIDHRISRVVADPAVVDGAVQPGGDSGQLVYYRLHGSPRIYWSNYSQESMTDWANKIREDGSNKSAWVIFDNTGEGYAASNALQMQSLLK